MPRAVAVAGAEAPPHWSRIHCQFFRGVAGGDSSSTSLVACTSEIGSGRRFSWPRPLVWTSLRPVGRGFCPAGLRSRAKRCRRRARWRGGSPAPLEPDPFPVFTGVAGGDSSSTSLVACTSEIGSGRRFSWHRPLVWTSLLPVGRGFCPAGLRSRAKRCRRRARWRGGSPAPLEPDPFPRIHFQWSVFADGSEAAPARFMRAADATASDSIGTGDTVQEAVETQSEAIRRHSLSERPSRCLSRCGAPSSRAVARCRPSASVPMPEEAAGVSDRAAPPAPRGRARRAGELLDRRAAA